MPAHRRFLPHVSVAFLAILVHARTCWFGFVFDDQHLIVSNTFLSERWSVVRSFAHHFWYGTIAGTGYYRPLVVASLAINGRVFGWGPAGFHAVNILLHALNAALLFVLAKRLTGREEGAWLAAAFFAAHPVSSWPVASIAARVDLLPLLFVLLAWIAYESGSPAPGPAGGPALVPAILSEGRASALMALSFLCALLCKESAVAFLVVPLLRLRGPGGGRRSMPCAAAAGALGLYLLMRRAAGVALLLRVQRIDPLINPLALMPPSGRLGAALALSGRYLLYLLCPIRFSDPRDYSTQGGPGLLDPAAIGTAISLVSIAALLAVLFRRRHPIVSPLAFALASFLPASNLLVPIASLYAVNFLYMPLAGLSLAIARLPSGRRRPALLGAAAAVIVLLGAGAALEDGIWKDGLSLFTAWTGRFPRYAAGHANLGRELLAAGRPREALEPLRKALEIDDTSFEAHHNLGVALTLTATGDAGLEEALDHERTALELSPGLAPAFANASRILTRLGRPLEAEGAARRALAADPTLLSAREFLAVALQRQARFAEAAGEFEAIVRARPADEQARAHYIVALLGQGDLGAAERETLEGRRIFPDSAYFVFCQARLAARQGRRDEALRYLRQAAGNRSLVKWIAEVDDFEKFRGSEGFEEFLPPPAPERARPK
jgi:protein O-mannosyl-transferase